MKCWVKAKKAPQWACRAPFDFLVDKEWRPYDDLSKAIEARYLILNGHAVTKEWERAISSWLNIALKADKESKSLT
ncbi:hypothetical protein [Vibrio chagasii]|uniref:hypothetical protein n=1 Tax=Vibrio chagasii TaxID=170679 RepID=UPI001F113A94|nr:hypothetical protein [Vibrio chagasii]